MGFQSFKTTMSTKLRSWKERNPPEVLNEKIDTRFRALVISSVAVLLVAGVAGSVRLIFAGEWPMVLASAAACVAIAFILSTLTGGRTK
jgi:membrane protein YdbS with pleckstrin-like domain